MSLPSPTPECGICGLPAAITVAGVPCCETCFEAKLCVCCSQLATVFKIDGEPYDPLCAEHAENERVRRACDDDCPGCEGGHGFLCAQCQRTRR